MTYKNIFLIKIKQNESYVKKNAHSSFTFFFTFFMSNKIYKYFMKNIICYFDKNKYNDYY